MFKSVFIKHLVAFLIVFAVCFVTFFSLIVGVMSNYAKAFKESLAVNAAQSVCLLMTEKLTISGKEDLGSLNENDRQAMETVFSTLATSLKDGTVVLTGKDGTILCSAGTEEKLFPRDRLIEEQYTDAILVAELGEHVKFENLVPLVQDAKHLIIGTPVLYESDSYGCVIVIAQTQEWGELVTIMVQTLVVAGSWLLVVGLVAIFFVARHMTAPLKEISRAARSFAEGKFDVQVRVRGKDEIAQLGMAFNQMAASLENMEKMRNDFISNVSHELRTPMTSISGFVDAILDGVVPPDRQEHYLRLVSDEIKRLSRLVTTLLDLSRLESGKRKFAMKPFNIAEVARQVLIGFEKKIDEKRLAVEFTSDEDSIYVIGDRDAIHQIIFNLIDNATKFSNDGGTLRICLAVKAKEKKAVVTVFNEGIGIAEEEQPMIFDRFYKSDKSRSQDKQGLGLGLYIAKTIIDAHGGKIWVESEYGKNCEFGFQLALAGPETMPAAEEDADNYING